MINKDTENVDGRSLVEKISDLEPALREDPRSEKAAIAAEMTVFLRFLLEEVPLEDFLADRLAQANTDVVIDNYGGLYSDHPFPKAVINRTEGGKWSGTSWINSPFMLKGDDDHLYYFWNGWPIPDGDGGLSFLGKEDIVPFEDYSWDRFPKHRGMAPGQDFTKPLERVAISGGSAERYNYRVGEWESSGPGESEPISPDLIENAKAFLQAPVVT